MAQDMKQASGKAPTESEMEALFGRKHFAERIVDVGNGTFTARTLRDVADKTALVGQFRKNVTGNYDIVTNIELLSVEWVHQFSIENESQGHRTKEQVTEMGMTVTSGKEVSDSISASAGFSGWGFSAQVNGSTEVKTFNSLETSTLHRITDTYTCPPNSSIFVYKRKYKFRCRTWFYLHSSEFISLDCWVDHNGRKVEEEFVNEIIANQELISPVALTSVGQIANNPPAGLLTPTKGLPEGYEFLSGVLVLFKSAYPWVAKFL